MADLGNQSAPVTDNVHQPTSPFRRYRGSREKPILGTFISHFVEHRPCRPSIRQRLRLSFRENRRLQQALTCLLLGSFLYGAGPGQAETAEPIPQPNVLVHSDGSVLSDLRLEPRDSNARAGKSLYSFGLLPKNHERRWLEKEVLPICHTQWENDGIRYRQIVLLTRLGEGDLMPDGKIPSDSVLLVQLSGENTSGEYTLAKAEFSVTFAGTPLRLELREDLAYAVGSQGNGVVAALEIPSGTTIRAAGDKLQFQGQMPPGTSGSMTVKIPIRLAPSEAEIARIRDLDFDQELRRVKRFWTESSTIRSVKPLPVGFAEP